MSPFARGVVLGVGACAVVAATLGALTPVRFDGPLAEARDTGKELWRERSGARPALPSGFSPLPSLAPLIRELKPAVISVATSSVLRSRRGASDDFFRYFFGQDGRPERMMPRGQGSGFIIHESGLALTNNHVIEGADQIEVKLADGRDFQADVVGRDPKTDVALIRIRNAHDLPTVNLGDSDALQVGDWVVAIGNPFGLAHSTSVGIVSAKERFIGAGPYDDFIQTDAAINPGNSGGPLFDSSGQVIGINTAIVAQGQGIGFAVPINLVKTLIPQLEATGRVVRGWLGVVIQDVTPELGKSLGMDRARGALVAEVVAGSPAHDAGLRNGDVVTSVDGRAIEGHTQLLRTIGLTPPGSKLRVGIVRDGKPQEVAVTVTERLDEPRVLPAGGQRPQGQDLLGLSVTAPPPQVARKTGGAGVVVTEVAQDSPAARAGLLVGDLILEINRRKVTNVREYVNLARTISRGQMALLRVQRAEGAVYIAVRVD